MHSTRLVLIFDFGSPRKILAIITHSSFSFSTHRACEKHNLRPTPKSHHDALEYISLQIQQAPGSSSVSVHTQTVRFEWVFNTMSLQIDNLEQFKDGTAFWRRNGFRRSFKIILTGTIYLIPTDEPRPIEDLRRWDVSKISPTDRKRVYSWSRKRCDLYILPREVVRSLDEPVVGSSGTATHRVSAHELDRTGQQLQTNDSKVDGRPKELPMFRESNDHCSPDQSSPPPYLVISAPSVAIDIPVNPELPTPPDADQPLPSLSTLHTKLEEITNKYACCHLQILAAEEVLGNDFDFTRKSQRRGQTSTEELEIALLDLVEALAGLERVKWEAPIFEPLQRSTISDIGKVLQDLDSFVGEVDKLSEYLRFLAFHVEDATQLTGPQAPDAIYLLQVCKRLERRVKGVEILVTGMQRSKLRGIR